MAGYGTPHEGKDSIIAPAVYTASLSIGLYTNAQNSLDATTVLADITEPDDAATFDGYARQTLNGSWAFSNGVVTYTPNIQFENTGASSWTDDVTGAFITDGVYLLHFLDRASGPLTMTAGKILEVDISTLLE
jgi:hypothetical protein